jgi:hypothetical protein
VGLWKAVKIASVATLIALSARCAQEPDASGTAAASDGQRAAAGAGRTPITHETTAFDGWIEGSNVWIASSEIAALADDALAHKLYAIGLTPTEIPQFLHATLRLGAPVGCDSQWGSYYCPDRFALPLTLTIADGPDQLDEVSIDAEITSMERAPLRRRLAWAVDTLVDEVVDHGAFDGYMQTPYY